MKYLLCLFIASKCLAVNLDGFTKPLTEDDSEACFGAERVIVASQPAFYRPLRQKCLVKAPLDGKYRTYEVIACANLASKDSVCDGFSSVDTTAVSPSVCLIGAPPALICRGFNVQIMGGSYVGVASRDDLTEIYTATANKQ